MNLTYQLSDRITYSHIIEKIENFTFPPIRKQAQLIRLVEPFTGIWALKENKMVGLILTHKTNSETFEIISFYVIPELRKQGIGRTLLSKLEGHLVNSGTNWIQGRYRRDWKEVASIEKILQAQQWETPGLLRKIAQTDIQHYTKAPWPEIKQIAEIEVFPWEEINEADKVTIREFQANNEIPSEFSPFQNQDKLFVPTSAGIRYKGKLIGWNIAYKLDGQTLEYNNLFIHPEYQRAGHGIRLLQYSLGKQADLEIPKLRWLINANNQPMEKIVDRLTRNILEKSVDVMITRKSLVS